MDFEFNETPSFLTTDAHENDSPFLFDFLPQSTETIFPEI